MMGRLKRLVRNRNSILLFALALGLVWGGGAAWTKSVILPVLMLVMTVSTMSVTGQTFRSPRLVLGPALLGIALSYGPLTLVLLGLSHLLISDQELRAGFVIIAAVPPAVAVLPFTSFLGGDDTFSLIGLIGGYLGALLLAPLVTLMCLGSGFFSTIRLITIVFELVLLPLVISRVLLRLGLDQKAGPKAGPIKGAITNWGFFVIMYTIVGLNRDLILGHPLSLLPVALIAVASTFALGWGIERAGRILRIPAGRRISLVLLGTLKNYGLAGGMALSLFSERTSVPATISSVFMLVYIIWLGVKIRRPGTA